ncbi:hypothetical protein BHE74_00017741 [Ensete ventricosum]|nr:hypothetical protein BHE74_00017741 [Ensete ventricosum]RZR81855.1 hypothetical protein BHM03_00008161 [Ensete ventricosum]
MKNPYNNIISLLPLQEFMFLTSVQGKFCASAPCFIFYVDSLRVAWILHQVPPKLLLVTSSLQATHVSDGTCDMLCNLFTYD